jgi:voltage-gated potassium channel Kch
VTQSDAPSSSATPFVVIAGYGLPGRTLGELLSKRGIDFTVIELNAATCQRAGAGGIKMLEGNAADPEVLKSAGAERATLIALMVPSDDIVLRAVSAARAINPTAHIIARCSFTSSGLEAMKRGANETTVSEQLVARELASRIQRLL